MPLRGHSPYLLLLYVWSFLRTFGFSSRTCHFGVPCSETRHLYLNATGASLRGSFQQSCTRLAIQFPLHCSESFRTLNPRLPSILSHPSSTTISKSSFTFLSSLESLRPLGVSSIGKTFHDSSASR